MRPAHTILVLILCGLALAGCAEPTVQPTPYVEVGKKEAVDFNTLSSGHTTNAMVGQVNGHPIYADEIFREITFGGADLVRLGSESTHDNSSPPKHRS